MHNYTIRYIHIAYSVVIMLGVNRIFLSFRGASHNYTYHIRSKAHEHRNYVDLHDAGRLDSPGGELRIV